MPHPEFETLRHPSYQGVEYHRYKGVDFYYRTGSSRQMAVYFHGAVKALDRRASKTVLPVFLGYNKQVPEDPHVLCFADRMLSEYAADQLELSWYLDSEKLRQVETIREIVTHYRKEADIRAMVFFGSSGGGFPSLTMAAHFHEYALIANSQLLLAQHPRAYDPLLEILARHGDRLLEHDVYRLLEKTTGPKRIYNYCNLEDYTAEIHHKPVLGWMERRWPGCVEHHWFNGSAIAAAKGKRAHQIRYPENETSKSVLSRILQQI